MPRDSFDHVSFGCGIVKGGRYTNCAAPIVQPPFEWSGTFPFPANNSTDLIAYLNVALGEDSSHLYQMESNTSVDVGTLTGPGWQFFATGSPAPTTALDANYRLGAANVLVFDGRAALQQVGTGNSLNLPSAMDGTKSFLLVGIGQVDTFDATQVNNILVHKYNNSTQDGWFVSSWNDVGGGGGARRLRFSLNQGGTSIQAVSPAGIRFELGVPFAWIAALDVAAGKIQVMTSVPGSYGETTYTDVGDFDVGLQPMRIGNNSIPGLGDTEGVWCQLASLEWDPAIDAGLTEENMTNFLKYTDGYLTV